MIARFCNLESDHRSVMWEVHGGAGRWWTVCFLTESGEYVITDETGRTVSPKGRLGKAIIEATKK